MFPSKREAVGELFARRVSWADAWKTLSQSTPGLVPTWAVYPWVGVGVWKPRGSDFFPGSPGMCVRSYSHDLAGPSGSSVGQ